MSVNILQTRLSPPDFPQVTVRRQRLIQRLETMLEVQSAWTVITAPAGTGKTTLLQHWLNNVTQSAVWISLDEEVDSPTYFIQHLFAGFKLHITGMSDVDFYKSPDPTDDLAVILQAIETYSAPVVLVLDDYDRITSPEIDSLLTFISENRPTNLHVVLTVQEAFSLSGQIEHNLIQMSELCFTDEEIQLLLEALDSSLSGWPLEKIVQITDGQAIKLQLLHLAASYQSDLAVFLSTLEASAEVINRRLVDSILENQPENIQKFLLYTSIPGRMNAELCDEIMNAAQSAHILHALWEARLFIMVLDNQYHLRYHPVFARILREKLQEQEPDIFPKLHHRAANWFKSHGFYMEALRLAITARLYQLAGQIIELYFLRLFNQGNFTEAERFIRHLPDEIAEQSPMVTTSRAFFLNLNGQIEEAERLLQVAESQKQRDDNLQGFIDTIYSHTERGRMETGRAVTHGEQALDLLSRKHVAMRNYAAYGLGKACIEQGDFDKAERILLKTLEKAKPTRNAFNILSITGELGRLRKLQGRLDDAITFYKEARQWSKSYPGAASHLLMLWQTGLADCLREKNELDSALELIDESITLSIQHRAYPVAAQGAITKVYIEIARQQTESAWQALQQAHEFAEQVLAFSELQEALYIADLYFQLAVEGGAAVLDHLQQNPFRFYPEAAVLSEQKQVLHCRALIADAHYQEGLELLEQLIHQRTGNERLIELLILQASVFFTMNQAAPARLSLEQSLVFAAPQGYVRLYLDEGRPIQLLLQRYITESGQSAYTDYARHLLKFFKPVEKKKTTATTGNILLIGVEKDILRLLATDSSEKQIASALFLNETTVKKYVLNIYRKLKVETRAQAVGVGRQLGLLD